MDAWFFATVAFLVLEYGRPQDVLPVGMLRLSMLTALVLIWFVGSRGRQGIWHSPQVKLIWAFIAVLAVLTPFARNNFMAFATTRSLFLCMPFIISVVWCTWSMHRLRVLVHVGIACMVYVAIYTTMHGGIGSGSFFQDENDVSLYLNMWIPFCYFLLFAPSSGRSKVLLLAGLCIGLGAVVVSFSRGGFLGLVAVSLVIWLVSPRKIRTLAIIGVLATSVYFLGGDRYVKEMSTVTDTKESTANERLLSWEAGWHMFKDRPLGWGGNNFQVLFPHYQSEKLRRNMWGRVAHSLWFTLIPETGIAGILIYLSLMVVNVRNCLEARRLCRARRTDRESFIYYLSLAFLASMAGFFVSGSFISVLYYPHYWYLSAIIAATVALARSVAEEIQSDVDSQAGSVSDTQVASAPVVQ